MDAPPLETFVELQSLLVIHTSYNSALLQSTGRIPNILRFPTSPDRRMSLYTILLESIKHMPP